MFRTSFKVLSKFRYLVRISTQRSLCTSLGRLGMPLSIALVDVFAPPVALHIPDSRLRKRAPVFNAKESLIMKPPSILQCYQSLRTRHHWTMFQAIRYALWLAPANHVHLHRAVGPIVRFEQFPNTLWIMVLDSGGSPRTINCCEVI